MLAQFGDRIGSKEFIILISLLSEKEKREKEAKSPGVTAVASNSAKMKGGALLKVADVAKDFTVQMIDGKQIRLSDLKGKVVLVNFWATWCAPCLMEFYEFPSKIMAPFQNRDFVLLAISRGESKEKVAEKMLELRKDGIRFNVGIDPNEAIWNLYAEEAIPKNFLIDQNGMIRYVATGNSEGGVDRLAAEIKKLLDQ